MKKDPNRSRRDFLKTVAVTGAGLSLGAPSAARTLTSADSRSAEPAVPDKVPRRELGTTGRSIPILVLGGGQTFDPRFDRILHNAFKAGVDFLDTALLYSDGMSHKTIAPFVKQVGRENLFLLSKGPAERATVARFTRDLDTCLRQLETDYLDMYFMHAVDNPRYLDREYIQMGEQLRKSGKAHCFGFSTCGGGLLECMHKAARVGGIDAIMFRYSYARYGDLALNKAIDACRKAGVGLIAMKTQNCVPADHEYVKEFRSNDFTLAQAKLKAVWADERIDAATSLMDNTRKLAENVAAAKSPAREGGQASPLSHVPRVLRRDEARPGTLRAPTPGRSGVRPCRFECCHGRVSAGDRHRVTVACGPERTGGAGAHQSSMIPERSAYSPWTGIEPQRSRCG
jgi:aryl-alcohol dehydrogenase-like predicted oxidoreductase